ncbi:hypothetical protein AB0L53_57140 [Nonomuraea sp. NPDC052129]|uniref:hypothetical protein n=1 Tax=Nonomuraea sp. NPDC052129 TaxID=3154651 RepID=UPI00344628C1
MIITARYVILTGRISISNAEVAQAAVRQRLDAVQPLVLPVQCEWAVAANLPKVVRLTVTNAGSGPALMPRADLSFGDLKYSGPIDQHAGRGMDAWAMSVALPAGATASYDLSIESKTVDQSNSVFLSNASGWIEISYEDIFGRIFVVKVNALAKSGILDFSGNLNVSVGKPRLEASPDADILQRRGSASGDDV